MCLLKIDLFLSHSLIYLYPLALVEEVEVVEVVEEMFLDVVTAINDDIIVTPVTFCMDFLPRSLMQNG